jgi:hypothetical protein
MKKIALILSLFTFFACENPSPNTQKEEKNTTNTQKVSLKYTDLEEKVFEIGGKQHYVADSCKMMFECDCCAGSLVFNADSTFYYEANCMADYEIFYGKYEIEVDKVNLTYTPHSIAYEEDKNQITATNLSADKTPKNQVFSARYCNRDKLLLENETNNEIAVITTDSYQNYISFLQKQGVLKYFKK